MSTPFFAYHPQFYPGRGQVSAAERGDFKDIADYFRKVLTRVKVGVIFKNI